MKETNWTRVTEILLLWQVIAAVTGGVMTAGVALVLHDKLPPQIPLFYSRPWGQEQLGQPMGLVFPIVLMVLTAALGQLAARQKIDRLLAAFVTGAGLAGEIIIMLGIIRILFLIT